MKNMMKKIAKMTALLLLVTEILCDITVLNVYAEEIGNLEVEQNEKAVVEEFIEETETAEQISAEETSDEVEVEFQNNEIMPLDIIEDSVTEENQKEISYENVSDCDMTDFSNWRKGDYAYNTGMYQKMPGRICLWNYKSVDEDTSYTIVISDESYHILIREMDADNTFVRSNNLVNGDAITFDQQTDHVGISIYNASGKNPSLNEYQTMFSEGFIAVLTVDEDNIEQDKDQEEVQPPAKPDESVTEDSSEAQEKIFEDISDCDMTNFVNWRKGDYLYNTGKYTKTSGRICLQDYKAVEAGVTYTVEISNDEYHILIREMSIDDAFIKSYNLDTNTTYTPNENTDYIGVSIYNVTGKTPSLADYKELFEDGFQVTLTKKASETDSTTSVSKDAVYDILYTAINEQNYNPQNISEYQLDIAGFAQKWFSVLNDYPDYYEEYSFDYTMNNGIIQTVTLIPADSYEREMNKQVQTVIANIISNIPTDASEYEKIRYIHDYIAEHTDYDYSNWNADTVPEADHREYGVLLNGMGVCDGYAKAFNSCMNRLGIESVLVTSEEMNHVWSMVKIDGGWYHVDVTFDDCYNDTGSGEIAYLYFLKTDEEIHSLGYTSWFSNHTSSTTSYVVR